MVTKTKAKKAVNKPAITKRAKKVDTIYWVLSERSKLLLWKPIQLFKSYDAAVSARKELELASPYSLTGYKVDRVDLKG